MAAACGQGQGGGCGQSRPGILALSSCHAEQRWADEQQSMVNDQAGAAWTGMVQRGWMASSCPGWLSLLQPQKGSILLLCLHSLGLTLMDEFVGAAMSNKQMCKH